MRHALSTHESFKITLRAMLLMAALLIVSCTEEAEPYPDLVTEFADIRTDADGMFIDITTDDGTCYSITNTNIQPHRPDTTYRAVAGFVSNGSSTEPHAQIYTLTGAQVLADSTAILRQDPTGVESMWHEGQHINMQLTAKTHGGRHTWGYAIDFIEEGGKKERAHAHYHLSLHHNQGDDPTSYSQTYYCSIHTTQLPQYKNTDTITVSVHTFKGIKSWTFSN
ncbi:MAG: NigD-like N-terminal domain-containing protein [Bacteroidaceae bacterium]|nr:NigD-like N-terminal domain-containing protein [Bacteroidaceae bacterium]